MKILEYADDARSPKVFSVFLSQYRQTPYKL